LASFVAQQLEFLPSLFDGKLDQGNGVLDASTAFERARSQGNGGEPLPKFFVGYVNAIGVTTLYGVKFSDRMIALTTRF
jgi:hypothetical protein